MEGEGKSERVSRPLFAYRFFEGGPLEIRDQPTKEPYPSMILRPEHISLLRTSLLAKGGRGDARLCWYTLSTWEGAQALALLLSDLPESGGDPENGETWIATDAGEGCYPRFGLRKFWKVGEAVSYGIGGDCYPDGTIVKIGKGRQARIRTSEGHEYRRHKFSGAWYQTGSHCVLIRGTHDVRDPSF